MAETPLDDTEPAAPGNQSNQAPINAPLRDQDVLQEVLALLSTPVEENADAGTLAAENRNLRGALSRMAGLLRDKTGALLTQEKRVEALTVQVASLKDVVALTKDLLNIRNMEVQHLHGDMDNMRATMDGQRLRHNEMIGKLDNAMTLNEQLKEEYQTQLKLFQSLKEKYEQRASLMDGINSLRENGSK